MREDKFGQLIYSEHDLCAAIMADPERKITNCLVEQEIKFDPELELANIPEVITYLDSEQSIDEFDQAQQQIWHMPPEYLDMDIAKWLLDQCKSDAERQRVGQELLLYLERNLFTLLQYLKYLVDTMRKHNIVWGVGRGSSVSSYVLFLLGVHKINSMYYDLDINDFLR